MNWIVVVLRKYATFNGRAQRAEYWYFYLFYFVAYVALAGVDHVIGTWSQEAGVGLLSSVFIVAVLLPYLAVATRRLHDIGQSGWWQLIFLIPLIGAIVLLVFFARAGQSGSNEYGTNPLQSEA